MHVISLRALRDFWRKHPAAESPLRNWHAVVEATVFDDFNDLRRTFRSADHVAPYTVFDIGGNNYRLIAVIHYDARRVYVRAVMTHADYDDWCTDYRRGKR
jgi:mRNA interferase HigB